MSGVHTVLDAPSLETSGSEVLDILVVLLFLWVSIEGFFYCWYRRELRKAQELTCPPRLSLEDRNLVLDKMLLHAEDYGMWRQIQGWFLSKDGNSMHSPHEVGSEEFNELLAWAFFYKRVEDLDKEEFAWIEFASRKVAQDFNLDSSLRPGRTGVNCVRHTLDRVQAIHRPLIFYVAVQAAYILHGWLLRLRGFQRGRHKGLWYWYRLSGKAPGQDPWIASGEDSEVIAFFHGLGLGLLLYLPLLLRLEAKDQILFEMPWIAMNPFAQIPSSSEYACWVVEAMESHGVSKCVGMGHSFGSLPIAWLIRQYPTVLSRCILIDPVAIFLNLPDVCVNFLYKQPKTGFGQLIRFFGARELGIARTLMRHFFWTDSVLFPEMLPDGSSLILMESDRILPVEDIYTSAAKLANIHTVVLPKLDHGLFLVWPSAVSVVLEHTCNTIRGKISKF